MKRFFIYAVLVLIPASIQAEDLQFVTTLSSPVGTFAQLETADPTSAAVSPVVNFCNTRTSTGRIELRGANAYLQNLTLKNGTTLGGSVQEYRLSSSLNVNSGGSVKGKRLLANNMSLSGASSVNSQVNNTLYVSSMGVKGAKTGSLTIPSKVQTSNTGNNDEMEWSNIYSRDYTSGGSATGSSYSSYLLKSKRCEPPAGEPTSQSCPSGYIGTQTRTWNYNTCSWNAWQGTCTCKAPNGQTYWGSCPNGQEGRITYTWNTSTCRYKKNKNCSSVYKWTRVGDAYVTGLSLYPDEINRYLSSTCTKYKGNLTPCSQGIVSGVRCTTPSAVCYNSCSVASKSNMYNGQYQQVVLRYTRLYCQSIN